MKYNIGDYVEYSGNVGPRNEGIIIGYRMNGNVPLYRIWKLINYSHITRNYLQTSYNYSSTSLYDDISESIFKAMFNRTSAYCLDSWILEDREQYDEEENDWYIVKKLWERDNKKYNRLLKKQQPN